MVGKEENLQYLYGANECANEIVLFTRSKANKAYLLDDGSRKIPVYCHMTSQGLDACGGGGWTLVMKIDGSKVFKDHCFHI